MGITLTLDEITTVFVKQPQLLLLGMVLQYSVLPCIGYLISRNWGLTEGLAVGVALVSCMPGTSIQSLSSAAAAAAAPGPCTGTLGLMPVLCKASAAVSGPLLSTA